MRAGAAWQVSVMIPVSSSFSTVIVAALECDPLAKP